MQNENMTAAQQDASVENGAPSDSSGESEALRAELDSANARAKDNYDKFLLAMADFENYKKRMERRVGEIALEGRKRLLAQFLPVIDNLERALAYEGPDAQALRNGVQQTLRGFESVLGGENVRPIDVKGKPFDPNVAEAIGTQSVDGLADDTVVEVAEKGYTIGDELLRPAKVIVAKSTSANTD